MKFIEKIFSVKNETHGNKEKKCITFLGIKFKFKNKIKTIKNQLLSRINKTDRLNEFYFLQNQYREKLKILKNKIKCGKKIKVIFFCNLNDRFGLQSVYEEFSKSDLFEPAIFVANTKEKLFNENLELFQDTLNLYDYFKKHNYNVILGYNKESMKPISIDEFKPDIVFFQYPDNLWDAIMRPMYFNYKYLTCFIFYAYCVVNFFNYHHNRHTVNTAWKQFTPTNYDINIINSHSDSKGYNAVSLGFPKMDTYAKEIDINNIPAKILNGNPTIIYAPHWSIKKGFCLSTFHLYNKYFMNLLKKYRNINFVFKPHPELRHRFAGHWGETTKNEAIMSIHEYDNFCKTWDNQPNGCVYEGDMFIDLFKKSNCLITDCGSFIAEYLPSEKPCIYLLNPENKNPRQNYNYLGNKILDSYYTVNNEEEIQKAFEDVVLNKNDYKKEDRKKVLNEEFENIGCAGKKIVEYITNELIN